MKLEFSAEPQAHFQEPWPNAYAIFSWLEFAISIPYPTYLITTLKENGKANACWHSWGCFSGTGQGYSALMVLTEGGHTCANILRAKEWCINLPQLEQRAPCENTVAHNGLENDEITDAGFTAEPSRIIRSPRIAECLVAMECQLTWHRPLFEDSGQRVFAGRIVHVALDERACTADPRLRLEQLNTMYNVLDTLDPLSGETRPGGLGIVRFP
ncbi:MAG: flavin reductase [Anaerolineae bacterium]|nr:flavin reductase [Anaerolineae bacterium]